MKRILMLMCAAAMAIAPAAAQRLEIGPDDYLVAIEEGSTMVRIGSTIFGVRG